MTLHQSIFAFILVFALESAAWAQQDMGIEQQAKHSPVSAAFGSDGNWLIDVGHEYSWVKQGSRIGRWTLLSTYMGLIGQNNLLPYFEIDEWNRLGSHDYTVSIGNTFKFEDNSRLTPEVGFGGNARYLYRFKSQLEYQRKILGSLFGSLGGRYLNHADNDTFLVYPGIIFYFGDNEIALIYNRAITESRGEASSGVLRGRFVLNKRFSLYAGAAFGQRLFDIFEAASSEQNGYIAFAGFSIKWTDRVSVRTGFSYSMEKPRFIKRSLEAALSVKF